MPLDTVNFRLLRIFVTIVEAGGFTAAQGELNLSLSTISSHMSDLETRLGLTLCLRGRSGFRLTTEGQAVYDEVKRLLETIDRFDTEVRGIRNRLIGNLSIGLTDNTISDPSSKIEKVIARMTDEAPEVVFTIVTNPPHELLRQIISGQIQVAIASFPREKLGLEYIALYNENQLFYCGRDHPLFTKQDHEIDVNEVRKHDLISRYYWASEDLKIFSNTSSRAVVSDMEAAARLILSGRYLGYLPEHYARQFVNAGLIRPIRPNLFSYHAPFKVAYEPSQLKSNLVSFFIDLVVSEFKPTPTKAVSLAV
jgi:DNA-binding transcriptional LysR family regulator